MDTMDTLRDILSKANRRIPIKKYGPSVQLPVPGSGAAFLVPQGSSGLPKQNVESQILAQGKASTKARYPAIDELPPEGRGVNWDSSSSGSSSGYTGKMQKASDIPIEELLPNPYNRDLDRKKIERIKTDIAQSKEVYPIVYSEIDHDGKPGKMVIDGHHRYQALKELKYKKVPVVMADDRGTETKAPKEEIDKRIRRRYRIGQTVVFPVTRDGVHEEGVIVSSRTGDYYQIRSLYNGRNHLIAGRSIKTY